VYRDKEDCVRNFGQFNLRFDWSTLEQLKETLIEIACVFMEQAIAKTHEGAAKGFSFRKFYLQVFTLAFRVHQLVRGFSAKAEALFHQLHSKLEACSE